MFTALRSYLRRRAAAWISRRSPRQANPITLHRRRIYILPTRGGLYFGLLLFAMLLGSMNYSNSLGFALTFLLTGTGLVCMHHAHRNLLNLTVRAGQPGGVFAGGSMAFALTVANPATTPRYAIRADDGETAQASTVDVPGCGKASVTLAVPAPRRGPLPMPRIRMQSDFPMGLFRAWSWVHPEVEGLVYPAATGNQPLPSPQPGKTGGDAGTRTGREDFAGLRRYARGDPPRLIHWKAYPRTGALMIKQFTDPHPETLWLDWTTTGATATEARLSQLTRWVLDADQAGRVYGLRLPGTEIAPAAGPAHRERCLRRLALFGLDHDDA